MRTNIFILFLTVMLIADVFSQCISNDDCGENGLCINGSCAEKEESSNINKKKTNNVNRLGVFDIWINPMGFIMFGPTIGLEVRIAPATYLMGSYRAAGIDILYNSIKKAANEEDILPSSTGLGLGVKHFFKVGSGGHLLYVGGGTELLIQNSKIERSGSIEDMWGNLYYDRAVYKYSKGISILTHDGFRFRLGENKKLLLSLGFSFGIFIETSYERRWVDDNTLNANENAYWYDREILPVGTFEVSIGVGM